MGVLRYSSYRWVNIVKNIEEILTDHAWCEQKRPLIYLPLIIQVSLVKICWLWQRRD
jgi:hypothetical protein